LRVHDAETISLRAVWVSPPDLSSVLLPHEGARLGRNIRQKCSNILSDISSNLQLYRSIGHSR
jgi:hypothetical protein